MTLVETLTIAGLIVGPVAAVAITLWVEQRRKKHEQRVTVLRYLIATRHLPSDPGFVAAINLVWVEFNDDQKVLTAYREFIEAVGVRLDGINDQQINQNSATKLTRLIYEVARSLGFELRETDIQTTAYASEGWVKRETLLQDSQRAMRDIASILAIQAKLMFAPDKVDQSERQFIEDMAPKA